MSITFDCQCGMVNCRSIVNKTNEIKLEIINKNLDICALTETWLCEQDKNFLTIRSCPPGYKAISTPWLDHRGGGIGLIYRNSINVSLNSTYNFQSKECTNFKINLDWTPYLLDHCPQTPKYKCPAICNGISRIYGTNHQHI